MEADASQSHAGKKIRRVFWRQFQAKQSYARCFAQNLIENDNLKFSARVCFKKQVSSKTKVVQSFLVTILSHTTVAQGVLRKIYQKKIKFPWILLTTQTNLGTFTVAALFPHKL